MCENCKKLVKDKQEAVKMGDFSKVTDCQVLLKRCGCTKVQQKGN